MATTRRGREPRSGAGPKGSRASRPWTFLTNHAHVLICLAEDPRARIQDVAARVGITYRGVQRILDELEAAGYLARGRAADDARANVYRVDGALPLRHPLERHQRVEALLALGRR